LIAFLPLIDGVPRDVREQQALFLFIPHRAFRPIEAGAEGFDLRLGIEDCIKCGIQTFNCFAGGNNDGKKGEQAEGFHEGRLFDALSGFPKQVYHPKNHQASFA
jgi:hypothetical protein